MRVKLNERWVGRLDGGVPTTSTAANVVEWEWRSRRTLVKDSSKRGGPSGNKNRAEIDLISRSVDLPLFEGGSRLLVAR